MRSVPFARARARASKANGRRVAQVLVRHDSYFHPGLPYVDGVTWSFAMPIATQTFKFERGELDAIKDLNQSDFVRFTRDPRFQPFGVFDSEKEIWGESMNVERAPFDNIEVRKAVAAVIDRRKYRMLKAGLIHEATQVIPRDVPLYDPHFQGQEHSYEAALAHMAKAGFAFDPKTKKGGYPETIPYYTYPQSYPEYSGQMLAQELATIGLRIELRLVNYPAYLALTRRRGRVALSPQGWQADFPDPSDFFEALFHSRSIADEDSNNTSFYRNPRLDEILDRAHSELDTATRARLYGEANRIVCDDAPWAFAYSTRHYEVHHPYFRGYRRHPVWSYFIGDAWLDRAPVHAIALLGAVSAPLGVLR
jgi:ABC-type transport system substrate-binding protein